jgi:hypothetical protein
MEIPSELVEERDIAEEFQATVDVAELSDFFARFAEGD